MNLSWLQLWHFQSITLHWVTVLETDFIFTKWNLCGILEIILFLMQFKARLWFTCRLDDSETAFVVMMIKRVSTYDSDESLEWMPEGMSPFHHVSPTCLFMLVLPLCLTASLCVKTSYVSSHTGLIQSILVLLSEPITVTQQLLWSSLLISTECTDSLRAYRRKQHADVP